MPPEVLNRAGVLFALAGVLVFVGYYTFLAPWWKESFGTTLVIKDALLGALLLLTGVSMFLTLTPLELEMLAWASLVLLYGVGLALLWRTVVFGQLAAREGRDWAPKWLRRLPGFRS